MVVHFGVNRLFIYAERSHPVTDAPTFQHAAPDRAENAHWTCQASVLRRCTFSVEQSAGRRCWH